MLSMLRKENAVSEMGKRLTTLSDVVAVDKSAATGVTDERQNPFASPRE